MLRSYVEGRRMHTRLKWYNHPYLFTITRIYVKSGDDLQSLRFGKLTIEFFLGNYEGLWLKGSLRDSGREDSKPRDPMRL